MRKRAISYMIILFLVLTTSVPSSASEFLAEDYKSNVTIDSDSFVEYQKIMDSLNEEYGLSISMENGLVEKERICENLAKYRPEAYEKRLRKEIEEGIAATEEAKKKVASLGDVKWKSLPVKSSNYVLPANVSVYSVIGSEGLNED
ncbi:MAG: hypothetical protein J6Z46_08155 [Lachnospiraceae bacterium]|nr:hypothetical protein [Lachnospiraceae bacterium]